MSTTRQDIVVIGLNAGNITGRTDAGDTVIQAGDPVKFGGALTSGAAADNYANPCADGDPLVGTDQFLGVAAEKGTNTSTADGTVLVTRPIPNVTIMRGKASTAGNIDTDAELLAILYDAVTFGLSAGTYTIDENDGANAGGIMIMDGNIAKGTLDVVADVRAMRISVS